MQNGGVLLVNTSLVTAGSNVTDAKQWNGGQGVLVIAAQQLAPIVNLMFKTGDGASARQIKVNSGAIAANAIIPLMLPAGSYEMHSATGSTIGLYAALMPTP